MMPAAMGFIENVLDRLSFRVKALGALKYLCSDRDTFQKESDRCGKRSPVCMVAGAGFEPAIFRL